jgi:uncharacterized protein YkwD
MRLKFIASTMLMVSMMGCVPVVVPIPMGTTSITVVKALPQTPPAMAQFDQAYANLRAEKGLGPLISNAGLDQLAYAHAFDMVENNYLAHRDLRGRNAQDRARLAGVTQCGIGENVAQGQTSVAEVLQAWMDSPGHRANLLNSDYANYGIGRVNDTWVLVFALPC